MKILFWLSTFIIVYTFVGYGIILFFLVKLKRVIKGIKTLPPLNNWPSVTLIVAAFNEEDCIQQKIDNTLQLEYPQGKLRFIFITDGSTDQTAELISKHSSIYLMHSPERKGKINAVHRAMRQVDSEITVFTDANTFLNKEALLKICRHYADPFTGAVSGEKRVCIDEKSDATAGEGFYWKYESKLKKWDAELYSVVGAAGELFSIRTALYEPVPPDTILDDFMITLLIAKNGYRIAYEPDAYATETSSENVKEELKRKVRIAAGGIQSILRLKTLLNVFRHPVLSFQYISHRVLRWTVVPPLMILVFVLNLLIVIQGSGAHYLLLLAGQILFYMAAALGFLLEKRQLRNKFFFIPYYFVMMNYAVLAGIKRYFTGTQKAAWDKAKRKDAIPLIISE